MKRAAPKERDILRAILDYLAAEHVLAFRMQSAFTVAEYKGKKRAFRSGTAGMADIVAFPRPIVHGFEDAPNELMGYRPTSWLGEPSILWIEVKTEKGKQSPMQKSFQEQVEAEGHKYVLARSVADVMEALKG